MSEISDRYNNVLGPHRPLLTGQRNQCPSCGEFFRTNAAFHKHRAGKKGSPRQCMSTDTLRASGWTFGADGFWRLPKSESMEKWLKGEEECQ